MKYINNQNLKALLLSAMTLTLAACGGSTSDKIVDQIDTSYSASIAYINATDNSSTFFTKSTVYNEDLYSNRFNIVEVMRNESSARYTHEWISGANGTLFGTENAITMQDRVSKNLDLDNSENYWVVATNDSTPKLNILKRKQSDNASTYNVRVFSTKAVDITIVGTEGVVKRTEPDTATTFFNLENCSDLYVENNLINVCQDGNVGASYIAIVDENGQLALARE